MAAVRWTITSLTAPERPERQRFARGEVRPVSGGDGADADRRRSLREELSAAEERFPTNATAEAAADARGVIAELNRLGSEAVRVLQPLNEKALRLAGNDHIDEQA